MVPTVHDVLQVQQPVELDADVPVLPELEVLLPAVRLAALTVGRHPRRRGGGIRGLP